MCHKSSFHVAPGLSGIQFGMIFQDQSALRGAKLPIPNIMLLSLLLWSWLLSKYMVTYHSRCSLSYNQLHEGLQLQQGSLWCVVQEFLVGKVAC